MQIKLPLPARHRRRAGARADPRRLPGQHRRARHAGAERAAGRRGRRQSGVQRHRVGLVAAPGRGREERAAVRHPGAPEGTRPEREPAADDAAARATPGAAAGGRTGAVPGIDSRPVGLTVPARDPAARGGRLWELDALRGLMLVMMALTHLPTRLAGPISQPLGFVSGGRGLRDAVGLHGRAGSTRQREQRVGGERMARALWRRALKIYLVPGSVDGGSLFTVVALIAGFTQQEGGAQPR